MKTRKFGEILCEKSASDWATAPPKDELARTAADAIVAGVSVEDSTNEVIPDTVVDKLEVKRIVSQGELVVLPT